MEQPVPPRPRRTATDDRAHRRLAEAGGVALFNTGPDRGVAIGEFAGEPLYHASLAPDEYRAIFARRGLAELAYKPEDPDAGGVTVWLVHRL